MTMPSLVAKFQMKSFETAFKKQYSVLNNTINYLQSEEALRGCYLTIVSCPTENNPGNTCYSSDSSECEVLKLGMIDKLKLTPIKNDFSYPKRAAVKAEGGVMVNSTANYDGIALGSSAFILPDGTIVLFYKNATGYEATAFIIDVNGKKGPNKWGYDVFYLTLVLKNNQLRLTDEYASLANKGGRLPRTILMNKETNDSTGWNW